MSPYTKNLSLLEIEETIVKYTEITPEKLETPRVKTDKLDIKDTIIIGAETNTTEITKDRMKTPELETEMIRMRPTSDNGRRRLETLDTNAVYTTIDTTIITTGLVVATRIQSDNIIVNGLPISLVLNIVAAISFISLVMNILLWVYVCKLKSRIIAIKDENGSPRMKI